MIKIHCPRCGATMQQREVDGRIRAVCMACDHICYQNPVPAVGVVVALDERIVLVRRKFEPQAHSWCLPAGYMELDETAEEAAVRECAEETGLLVQVDMLLGVYSFGSGTMSGLVIMYTATAIGGQLQAGDDAAEVGVFAVDQLPAPMAFRTHLQAIEDWRRRVCPAHGAAVVPVQTEQDMVVRPARNGDEHQVLALLSLLPAGKPRTTDQALVAMALFHNHIRDPDNPILVAEVDKVVVGFVTLSFSHSLTGRRAAIDDLVVDSVYRRRGVGQALVRAAVHLAQTRRCQMLHMHVLSGTGDLQSFYRACGFTADSVATLWIEAHERERTAVPGG